MGKVVNLIFVDRDNKNKYYHMKELDNGTFDVEYGRVEKTRVTENYSMSTWDKKYREKIKKGYSDVTHLKSESVDLGVQSIADIKNSEVKNIIDILQNYAKVSIQKNYSVSSEKVTQAMVDEAQNILSDINASLNLIAKKKTVDVKDLDDKLIKLYMVIPRQMKRVQNHLFTKEDGSQMSLEDMRKLFISEQETLDVMNGQVALNVKNKPTTEDVQETMNILQIAGLEVEEIDDNEAKMIKKLMAGNSSQFKRAFRVKNVKTEKIYQKGLEEAKNKKEEILFHGSRNENFWFILEKGLLIRPSGAAYSGSMFGDGIYFASKAQKSINYTSISNSYYARGSDKRAFLALFKVRVGNQYDIHSHTSECYSFSKSYLEKKGYDSTHAHAGKSLMNDEFIVYDSSQCTINYLIEFTN
jgi:poly [ADP-ribose] polymerase 2/3/4